MSLSDQRLQFFPVSARVSAVRARGLRIKGKDGTNDAYAALQAGRETFRTPVSEKRAEPVWGGDDAAFIFTMPPEAADLQVRVLHRVPLGADKLLGLAVVDVHELRRDGERENPQWFKLLNKAGKADKERGEVLLDVQFLKSSMSVSMIDLSDKSHSRLGKFKDKLRGKKKDGLSDSASAILPSVTQVLTDSEGEMDGDKDTTKKKKNKLKSLFVPKSNMKRNSLSQSMSALGTLPDKNSSISSSTSSGLNVESSEGKKKKKFTFLTHKRTGSTDSKASNQSDFNNGSTNQNPASQIDICINGSHIYKEETQSEEVQEMDEEEEEEEGENEEEGEKWRREREEQERLEEMRRREAIEERKRKEKEEQRRKEEEEKERMRVEQEKEERRRMEEEERKRIRMERETEEKERIRMEREKEERKRMEEKERERIQIEKEKEERERIRMEREKEEERRRMEEEERQRIRIEREKEERRRMEEEERDRIRIEREKEEQKRRMEEEERERISRERENEERRRMEEEERNIIRIEREKEEQKKRMDQEEKERIRMEREKEKQIKRVEEERERPRIEKEEQRAKMEEERKRMREKETEAEELRRKEESDRKKAEEEKMIRIAEEEKKQAERTQMMEEEEKEKVKRAKMERKLAEEKEAREEEKRRIEEENEKRRKEEERVREEKERERAEMELKRKDEKKERRNMEMKEKQMREDVLFEERVTTQSTDFTRSARISNVKPSVSVPATVSQPSMVNRNPFLDDDLDSSILKNVLSVETTANKGPAPLPPHEKPQLTGPDGSHLKDISKRPAPQPPGMLKMTGKLMDQPGLGQEAKKNPEKHYERKVTSVSEDDTQANTNPFTCDESVAVKHSQIPTPKPRMKTGNVHLGETETNSKGYPAILRTANDITAEDIKSNLGDNRSERKEHLEDKVEPAKPNDLSYANQDFYPEPQISNLAGLLNSESSQKKSRAPLPPSKPKRTGDLSIPQKMPCLPNKTNLEQSHESCGNQKDQDNAPFSREIRAINTSSSATVPSLTFSLLTEKSQVMKPCAANSVDMGSGSQSRTLPLAKVVPNDAGEVKEQVVLTSVIRQHAVKPLSAAETQPEMYESRVSDKTQPNTKVAEAVKGPYSQLTQAELISLALRQQEQLSQRDARIQELEQYIDNLLVHVMEEKPSILMSMNAMKKSV